MTGYGYCEYSCEEYLMTMELKSYNNRFLEISYYSPQILSAYENEVTESIKKNALRGHIDFSVKLKTLKGNYDISIDTRTANEYIDVIKEVCSICAKKDLNININLSDILNAEGVLSSVSNDDMEKYRDAVNHCLSEVLKQFTQQKEREGLATQQDLETMINRIDTSLNIVKSKVDLLETQLKQNLTDKLNEMLEDKGYDQNRILTEVAVMLMRYTINEETVRLTAHIAEFRRLLQSNEAVGKRLDFLCQEMNREINTIGSKSQMVEVNFEVVNMKDCLENIREQIRNIE